MSDITTKELRELADRKGWSAEDGHGDFRSELEDALCRAADQLERQAWIPCSERMPGHGFYLAYDPRRKKIRLMQWYAQGTEHRWYDEEDNQFHGDISHWMLLPPLPPEGKS